MQSNLTTPTVEHLPQVLEVLSQWQHEHEPVQLHPGDVGWYWRFGAQATANAVRVWSREHEILAIGLLDEPNLIRLAGAPSIWHNERFWRQVADDLTDPQRGVLPAGTIFVEARFGRSLEELLVDQGWRSDAPWTPLRRDLTDPVDQSALRIEITTPENVSERVAVQRSAFERSTFTEERWHAMALSPGYANARCLVGHNHTGTPVAAATVWSAGAGRAGLLEPVGVHSEHRQRGYGRAITTAAAELLRRLGASSATVCTAASNAAAVATYRSAGFQRLPDVRDLRLTRN